MSKKKYHEIVSLGPLINEICEKMSIKSIIDVGSGLGYLSNLLLENYAYTVFGIEGSEEKVKAARILQTEVKFVHHYITQESEYFLKSLNDGNSIDSTTCIVGLHACADLSVIILDLFIKLPHVKALVLMPCCYHRLEIDRRGNFSNFPASLSLKNIVDHNDFEAREFLKVPFMRLACQRVCTDGGVSRNVDEEARNCLYRSILQDVAESGHYQVRRLRRKSRKKFDDFESYLSILPQTHELIGGDLLSSPFQDRMREKWTLHKENCYMVKALNIFQSSIQSICENLVLLDRVVNMEEKGVNSYIEKVTDDYISPRCYALVATKQSTSNCVV